MSFYAHLKTICLCAGMALLLNACSPITEVHGNILDKKRLSQLKVGETSQSDAFQLLGSPTTTSTVDQNVWYYIGHRSEQIAVYKAETKERLIVALQFDEQGTLADMAMLDESAENNIEPSDRETPSTGRQFTLMQQLLGNLGRFNKNDFE